MILTTDITLATTTSTATAQKKSYPNVITGPATSNATEDAVYKLTQYTYKTGKTVVSSPSAADQLIFNEDKENISWMFWVDGGLMDEDDEYIIIENKTLTDDSENDFTNESNKIQFQENLQANAYLEASIEVVEEGGETINKLTIKFSKWLDGYNIYIEPFRNSPDHSETEDYVETTMINASPEIIEVYWLNDQGKKVASIGYESEIDLVIHSLGIGNEQLDLSLYDDDSTDSTVDILNWNDGTTVKSETISERFTIISYDVEEEGHANYANALTDDSNSVVEAFVKIITTNTTLQPTLEDQYARIDFTPLEEVKTYLALREEVTINGQEYTQYNKLERVFPGMKAYLVAEVANLTGAVSFSITVETPLLEVANVKLPLLQNDVEGTDFAATIEDNYAITEVLFQELDSDTYDDWIALLMPATGTPAESEINIKVTVGTDEYDSAETLKITAPIVIQKIYHDGFISKENYIKDVAKKVKFEFHDTATNSPHDLGTFDLKWVQRWLYPGRTSSPGGVRGIDYVRHYKKKKADGTIVYA